MLRPLLSALLVLPILAPFACAGETVTTEKLPLNIPGIGPVGTVSAVRNNFQFTEGPAWDGKGTLYFTDIPANKIYAWKGGVLSTFLEPSSHCNGLMITANGKFYGCQMDGQLVEYDPETKRVNVLAAVYEGKRFNAPNDLVVDSQGGIYFTDPRFRAPMPWPQGTEAVYYRAPDGTVTRIVDDLQAPNGVILSPDEKTLYVVPSMQKEMMAYPVTGLGQIGEGKVLCTLKQPKGKTNSGGDGLTIDTEGRLYITSGLGVQIFSPKGDALGIIEFPEQPANVTFGGPERKTLFVTARKGLYKVQTEATGHVFPGKS